MADRQPVAEGPGSSPPVWSLPDVPRARPCAVNLEVSSQPSSCDLRAEERLGQGRAADVTKADKQNPHTDTRKRFVRRPLGKRVPHVPIEALDDVLHSTSKRLPQSSQPSDLFRQGQVG